MNPANLLTEWARVLLEGFAEAGVRDVVVSPGSRSTPFVYAASRCERLRLHSIADERAAAFFALGQARITGQPSLLICTSGSAPGHYLPAILEAASSFVPLVALSADRPPELHDCAANQTVDQKKLFGGQVRWFCDLGLPDPSPGALRALRRVAAQAVFSSRFPLPGAVHLNAPAKKPLEPLSPDGCGLDAEAAAFRQQVEGLLRTPLTRAYPPTHDPDEAGLAALIRDCRERERGLIVCGPAPVSAVRLREPIERLVQLTEFPLLAEATSQQRFCGTLPGPLQCPAFDLLLGSEDFVRQHRPELILQIGAPLTSAAFERYLQSSPLVRRWVLCPHGWLDPTSSASAILFGELERTLALLVAGLQQPGQPRRTNPSGWADGFCRADARVWALIGPAGDGPLTEGAIARIVVEALPAHSVLVVGNSLPVRELDTYCRASREEIRVVSQRGLSGIDGLVSGASGVAQAAQTPTTLLLGDVSFFHDLTGLQLARRSETPLVIVVIQNSGGRIFEQLPLLALPWLDAQTRELWTTPSGLSLRPLAELFGIPVHQVHTGQELRDALQQAHLRPGCSLLEAVVPPQEAAATLQGLSRAVAEALADPRPGAAV